MGNNIAILVTVGKHLHLAIVDAVDTDFVILSQIYRNLCKIIVLFHFPFPEQLSQIHHRYVDASTQ